MIRVLHVVTFLGRGGLEVWLIDLLKKANKEEFDFDIVVQSEKEGLFDQEVRDLGFKVIPCLGRGNPLKFGYNFIKVLNKYGPYDVVHSHVHHFSAIPLLIAKLLGVKVLIAHSHSNLYANQANKNIVKKIYLRVTEFIIDKTATLGLGCSKEATADLFGRDWQKRNDRDVLHCGINLSPFTDSIDENKLRNELGIPADKLIIGHVGRFMEAKNHELIYKVAKELAKLRTDFVFLLVGDGESKNKYEEKARADKDLKDKLLFLGDRSDVQHLLKIMTVFIFPSKYEGLGLALVEAQAAGLHCLVSDTIPEESHVVPELIHTHDLASTPESWANKLSDILNTTSKNSEIGLKQIKKSSHNLDNSILEIENIYKKLVG